jgi:hypothetical protein
MRNGDLSNETPPRIIVTIDAVVESSFVEEGGLFNKKTVRKVTGLRNAELSQLWNTSFKYGLAVELAAFEEDGWTEEHMTKLMERLDNRGGNPFNYSEMYKNIQDFIGELPYRSNLKGVISNGQAARFGSWGIDLEHL